jgi:CRISPR-associated protein Cmr2
MTHDFYAELASLQQCPADGPPPGGLVSGFVDGCTTWFAAAEVERSAATNDQQRKDADRKKNNARNCYMNRAVQRTLALPSDLRLEPWPPTLLHDSWLALEVEFKLLTPWYSKDDRPFHVLDNPVRKDRVFGVPFMSAASWKGMLRWACRMQAGLQAHFANGKRFKEWDDPHWILHLFGNEKGEEKNFSQGALVFSPTWFDKIGFEVINPHSRARRAGTQPIVYEVVPGRRPKGNSPNEHEEGGKGKLRLLYAPWPGMKPPANPADFLPQLLEAIEQLLTCYGISAKRTVGWGTAEISKWCAWKKDKPVAEESSREELVNKIRPWLESEASA